MYRTQNVVRKGLTPCPSGSMGPLHLTAGVVGKISHRSFESMNDVACKQIHEGMSHIVFLWIDETDVTYCGNREGGYHTVLLWMVGGGEVGGVGRGGGEGRTEVPAQWPGATIFCVC